MKWVNISDELIDILQPYTDWFFSQDLTELEKHIEAEIDIEKYDFFLE